MILFIDSDVIVSSLLSSSGAAYFLLHSDNNLVFYISSLSKEELQVVCERLSINKRKLNKLIDTRLRVVKIDKSIEVIKKEFKEYVSDMNDAHIVGGAKTARAKFIISYNIKHFKLNKIKNDLNILVLTPGMLLQYLRSLR